MRIRFGAMVPRLEEQLSGGFRFPPGALDQFQVDVDAVTRLLIRGVLTEGEARKARDRLAKSIEGASLRRWLPEERTYHPPSSVHPGTCRGCTLDTSKHGVAVDGWYAEVAS